MYELLLSYLLLLLTLVSFDYTWIYSSRLSISISTQGENHGKTTNRIRPIQNLAI